MKNKSTLPKQLQLETEQFFESVNPPRLSRNLRTMVLNYLSIWPDAHGFEIEELLCDLIWLFELLDTATDELAQ